jgi:hypothetical protein
MGSAMRRRANVWAMGHAAPKPLVFPEAEGPVLPEGHNTPLHTYRLGKEGGVSGGVFDHGTYGRGRSRNLGGPRLSSTQSGVTESR